MAFSGLPVDNSGIPISSVYVPGDAFRALQGSPASYTDGSSNISTPAVTQDFIRAMTALGLAYSISASGTTAGAADPGIGIFNNSTPKNMLIFGCMAVANATSTAGHSLRTTTINPALGTSVTPVNAKAGGAASGATCSSSNTQSSLIGSLLENFPTNSGSITELFTNGRCYLLPAGAANGFAVQFVFAGAQSWYVRLLYVEY